MARSRRIPDPAPPFWDPASLFGDPEPKLGDPLEFCSTMSLLVITPRDSMYLKNFHFSMRLLSFLVTERCGDRHKLVVRSYFVLTDYRNFILGF